LGGKTSYDVQSEHQIWSTRVTYARDEETKKDRKKPDVVENCVFAETTHGVGSK